MKKRKLIVFILFVSIISNFKSIYASTNNISYDLKEIVGYEVASISNINFDTDELSNTMLNELIQELRPFLKDAIDSKYEVNHVFTNKEALGIMGSHPIKFLGAIYNYVVYSLKEIFGVASDYAVVE